MVESETEPISLAIRGDLTADTAGDLIDTIRDACERPGARVVLHLDHARRLDSEGVGALMQGIKMAEDSGASLVIGRVSPELARVLSITGLDQLVPLAA